MINPKLQYPSQKVAILLCTYQGELFLREQLESYNSQTYKNWYLYVSDDGSCDRTKDILLEYQSKWGSERMTIYTGPARGYAANFLSLVCNPDVEADFYAFSDQDDIWEPYKLQRAVGWLKQIPSYTPALYCSRTRLINEVGENIGLSPLYPRKPSFANALVQNIVSGNTLVLNNAARDLLMEAGDALNIVSHDWWAYLLISGCGGIVNYDQYPTVRYRQHSRNLIGAPTNVRARIIRIKKMLEGKLRDWGNINIEALKKVYCLSPENRELLEYFSEIRTSGTLKRLFGVMRSGIYRQTRLGNFSLIMAALLNRI